jgi:hypothetical protein
MTSITVEDNARRRTRYFERTKRRGKEEGEKSGGGIEKREGKRGNSGGRFCRFYQNLLSSSPSQKGEKRLEKGKDGTISTEREGRENISREKRGRRGANIENGETKAHQ